MEIINTKSLLNFNCSMRSSDVVYELMFSILNVTVYRDIVKAVVCCPTVNVSIKLFM